MPTVTGRGNREARLVSPLLTRAGFALSCLKRHHSSGYSMQAIRSLRGYVSGRVQGVGFRYFVQRQASAEGLGGYVRNMADGRVEFLLQGKAEAVDRVLEKIRRGPDFARVSELVAEEVESGDCASGFVIRR